MLKKLKVKAHSSKAPGSNLQVLGWLAGPGKVRGLLFVGAFVVIGSVFLLVTHAATPVGSAEAETGTLGNGASVVNDTQASGGQAVQFGGGSSSCQAGPSGTAQPSGSSYSSNALQQWNCALADRASRPATWVAWGDSLTEGQGSSTVAGRWANQALNALRSKYPVSGVTGGFGYIPAWYGTYGPDSQWSTDPTMSGNATPDMGLDDGNDGQQLGNGPGLGLLTATLKSGGSDTFKVTGTSIDILYNYGSGSFSYKVDSGAATTVSASGSSGATGSKRVAFSAAGSHTVTISGVSGSVTFEGIMTYNGDEGKGIRLYDGAQCSMTSGDFVAQAANLAAITANVNADLVTIMLGGNDFGRGGGTASQLEANLKAMISDIRSAGAAKGHVPSIVIMLPYQNSDSGWSPYANAIKAVVNGDTSVGFLDLSSFPGIVGESSQYLSSTDELHPSNTGQSKLATMVESYLETE